MCFLNKLVCCGRVWAYCELARMSFLLSGLTQCCGLNFTSGLDRVFSLAFFLVFLALQAFPASACCPRRRRRPPVAARHQLQARSRSRAKQQGRQTLQVKQLALLSNQASGLFLNTARLAVLFVPPITLACFSSQSMRQRVLHFT